MKPLAVVAWVINLCADLRLSQAKTLAALVAAALRVERASLANIGRKLLGGGMAKHRIKRAWRFCANTRVEVADAMRGLVRRHLGRQLRPRHVRPGDRPRKRKPLLIALDWTDIKGFHTLMAAVVMKGRALPLLWATYTKWRLSRSQNNLEEGLLRLLRDMIPAGYPVIVLADRGFGRTELARVCQELKFRYLVRIKPDVCVAGRDYTGNLLDYPVKKGIKVVLKAVQYRKEDPVTQNVVIRWKENLPKDRDEPWFLMTDLGRDAGALTKLYGKRMTVEELFRDGKNKRNGLALRDTKVTRPDRIDRLLLILAWAYWLLVGVGHLAQRRYRPGMWCSSNDARQCSVFTIGKVMRSRMKVKPEEAFAATADAGWAAAPNWG